MRFAGVDTVVHLAGDPSPQGSWASVQRLNIDLTANVYEAAAAQGVRRVVFASSNWVMAGHRAGQGVLTTDMEPHPVNPYGVSKLVGERMGRSIHERRGLSVICVRIGYVQRGDNLPGPHMGWGRWGQAMWLSNRDLCHATERAVVADGVGFAVLNLMSDNPLDAMGHRDHEATDRLRAAGRRHANRDSGAGAGRVYCTGPALDDRKAGSSASGAAVVAPPFSPRHATGTVVATPVPHARDPSTPVAPTR
jgi:nucleoside-diphosphate-sugar epimerase